MRMSAGAGTELGGKILKRLGRDKGLLHAACSCKGRFGETRTDGTSGQKLRPQGIEPKLVAAASLSNRERRKKSDCRHDTGGIQRHSRQARRGSARAPVEALEIVAVPASGACKLLLISCPSISASVWCSDGSTGGTRKRLLTRLWLPDLGSNQGPAD